MEKTLWVLVDNGPEALMRVTGLIRRKGCTMKRMSMEETADVSYANLTITIGDAREIEQIICQMEKLINVHAVKEVLETVNISGRTAVN